VADATGDGFGHHDTLLAGDTTPAICAPIASLTRKGAGTGSAGTGDCFGPAARKIGAVDFA
jgi:hypothetical protein